MAKHRKKPNPEIVTQKTTNEKLLALIMQNRKEFLLSETAEATLEQMRLCRNLYLAHTSRTKVVEELVENHNYTERRAWRLADITPRLFSIVMRDIAREFYVDIHLEKIEETRRLAMEKDDIRTMAACDSNRAHAIEKFMGTVQTLKPEDLVLPDIEIAFHTELFKDIPEIGTADYQTLITSFKKRKDIQNKMSLEYIDYEPVTEDN